MTALIVRHPLWALTLPVLVWAAHFLTVYAFAALVCVSSVAQRHGLVALASAVSTVIALALIVASGVMAWRVRGARGTPSGGDEEMPDFVATGALLAAILAGVGVVWVAAPVFVLPPCIP